MTLGRDCWLKRAKESLESIDLNDVWECGPLNKRGERALARKILNRLNITNYQSQIVTAHGLRSLEHLRHIPTPIEGLNYLINRSDKCRIRSLSQVLLNCPGSLIRRERDLLICSSCSEPIPDRNVFIHRLTSCVNTSEKTKEFIEGRTDKLSPVPTQLCELVKLYSAEKVNFVCPLKD